eukprot:5854661-Pleurochrysis_carterae.AAC.1
MRFIAISLATAPPCVLFSGTDELQAENEAAAAHAAAAAAAATTTIGAAEASAPISADEKVLNARPRSGIGSGK